MLDAAHFSALVAMNNNSENTGSSDLPLAIPLMDVDHKILPLHFAIDPGEDVFADPSETPVNSLFDNLSKTFVLTEQDKIELLKKYFDILTMDHQKDNCVKKDVVVPKAVEKSQTLPSNFGRKPDFESEKSKTLSRKSSARLILQKPFLSFGRMSKRIKKNIGHLARRSASFRLGRHTSNSSNTQQPPEATSTTDAATTTSCKNNPSHNPETAKKTESIINTDNSVFYCETSVLAAKLYTNKRHLYYDEMIKNYLNTARIRFLKEKEDKQNKLNLLPSNTTLSSSSSISSISSSLSEASSSKNSSENSLSSSQILCVNVDCTAPASASTNYLCAKCFEEQKQALIKNNYTKISNGVDKEKGGGGGGGIQNGDYSQSPAEPKKLDVDLAHLKILPEITVNDTITHNFCIPNS